MLENPNGSNSNVSSSSPISDINQMKALLQRRKDAYVNNARLANAGWSINLLIRSRIPKLYISENSL